MSHCDKPYCHTEGSTPDPRDIVELLTDDRHWMVHTTCGCDPDAPLDLLREAASTIACLRGDLDEELREHKRTSEALTQEREMVAHLRGERDEAIARLVDPSEVDAQVFIANNERARADRAEAEAKALRGLIRSVLNSDCWKHQGIGFADAARALLSPSASKEPTLSIPGSEPTEAEVLAQTWSENRCGDDRCETHRLLAAMLVLQGGTSHDEHAQKVKPSEVRTHSSEASKEPRIDGTCAGCGSSIWSPEHRAHSRYVTTGASKEPTRDDGCACPECEPPCAYLPIVGALCDLCRSGSHHIAPKEPTCECGGRGLLWRQVGSITESLGTCPVCGGSGRAPASEEETNGR